MQKPRQYLSKINPKDIEEVQQFSQLHPKILLVLQLSGLIIYPKQGIMQWSALRRLLSVNGFLNKMLEIDVGALEIEYTTVARLFVEKNDMNSEGFKKDINKCSQAAYNMVMWAIAILIK